MNKINNPNVKSRSSDGAISEAWKNDSFYLSEKMKVGKKNFVIRDEIILQIINKQLIINTNLKTRSTRTSHS